LLEENLHLWPAVIAKAMPQFSATIIDPQTNFIQMCWIIGPAVKKKAGFDFPINITKSFYTRQKQLQKYPIQRTKLEQKMAKYALSTAEPASESASPNDRNTINETRI
jgi:hypothetical protein